MNKSCLISVKKNKWYNLVELLPWDAVLGRYFFKNTKDSCKIFLPTRLFSRFYTYTFINFQRLFPPTRLFGLHIYSVVQSRLLYEPFYKSWLFSCVFCESKCKTKHDLLWHDKRKHQKTWIWLNPKVDSCVSHFISLDCFLVCFVNQNAKQNIICYGMIKENIRKLESDWILK